MTAIVAYNAGNTASVKNALERLGEEYIVTYDPDQLRAAARVIFPGVGEAGSAMNFLRKNNLDKVIQSLQQPFLGICLGQQLMCSSSEEGRTDCLGIFPVKVRRFPSPGIVPHVGWNNLINLQSELFNGITEADDVYFVHSYYAEPNPYSIASCDYILPFSAAMQKDNFFAVQFHPEKSGSVGEQILNNFLNLEL